ncbi:MAG TPA: helix-turn-helix domain-containing protein [Actinomycetes bacterium]|nr:helix-turn-helix domain-containing protein [Actinomycetes bacterium]
MRPRAATVRRLERSIGTLASAAIARMDETLPWYRQMSAEHRSWVGLVAQAGIAAFVEWFRHPDEAPEITADVFGTAPRELARAVTLQQTVELVRVTIEIVEERVGELAAPGEEPMLRQAVLRYSREIAFAAAEVYARAAEARGAWDARLEALVVDALLRGEADEAVRSRAAALGWGTPDSVVVVAGLAPDAQPDLVVDGLRRAARHAGYEVLTGVHGDRLVAVLGGVADPLAAASGLVGQFRKGPVVVGPTVGDLLVATRSAEEALSGLRAAPAWPDAPRPVHAADLLPERALLGDEHAKTALVEEVYRPLAAAGSALLETAATYLQQAASLESAARMLFVHPNTIRYRLRRVTELTGYAPTDARSAFVLQVALALGRLDDAGPTL